MGLLKLTGKLHGQGEPPNAMPSRCALHCTQVGRPRWQHFNKLEQHASPIAPAEPVARHVGHSVGAVCLDIADLGAEPGVTSIRQAPVLCLGLRATLRVMKR